MTWCDSMTEEEFFDSYVDWETAVAHLDRESRRALYEERWAEDRLREEEDAELEGGESE